MNIAEVLGTLKQAVEKQSRVVLTLMNGSHVTGAVEALTGDNRVKMRHEQGVDYVPIKNVVNVSVLLSLTDRWAMDE
ncbi:hypothetical protein GZH47_02135 [Paenibacillus rhizovicinus]|uniref:DUF2642 domain-containing protein n=1 Tax=Paenibacillus rhizovicinus TaxID=2704463 RepID=A0A6C0NU56_9BACL|nr:hypothetical protein [Paenibacillus rhizovicinus]QHW29754.1 hypothetical protein GZH47_02135 [Paenibacillus rhizovicinus]